MNIFALLVLSIGVLCGTANADFIDNWQLESWTASGPGKVAITPPSGAASSATFMNAGPTTGNPPVSSGFDYSGTATINFNPAGTGGFSVGGNNFDRSNHLMGNLAITNFDPSTSTPEPGSFGLLGSGAALLAFGAWGGRKREKLPVVSRRRFDNESNRPLPREIGS